MTVKHRQLMEEEIPILRLSSTKLRIMRWKYTVTVKDRKPGTELGYRLGMMIITEVYAAVGLDELVMWISCL